MSTGRSTLAVGRRGGQNVLPALLAGAAVVVLAFRNGGYDATSWSWTTIAATAVAVTVLLRSDAGPLPRTSIAFVGCLTAFAAWIGLECLRRGVPTRGVPQLERALLYVAVAAASVLVIRRMHVRATLVGLLAAIVVATGTGLWKLLLGPVRAERYEGRLLFQPLGYANACGIFAVIGILLAFGITQTRAGLWERRFAATALVPLVVGVQLTASRGAVAAGFAGWLTSIVLSSERSAAVGRAVLALALPLVGALAAARLHVGDTHETTGALVRNGRLLAAIVVALCAAQWAIAARAERFGARVLTRRRCAWAVAVVAVVGAFAVVRHGVGGSLGDRPAYWHVAWIDARSHPLLGSGPGSYGAAWIRLRPTPTGALNAHNLYLETLAELGPAGLALLVAALAIPFVVAVRRRSTWRTVAAGAYVAFLVHAALDWDWQMPAVTIAALLCGACILAENSAWSVRRRAAATRFALAGTSLVALLAGAEGVGAHALAAARSTAGQSPAAAVREAEVAAAWQPWSAEPRRLLAELDASAGDLPAARRALEQAVLLDPADVRTWFDLVRFGLPREQRTALERIAELDPLGVRTTR
ncbi:MAG TPA: O-antigen ligase family protein [Gaiellaceae bacterium]